mmetsp:Transcript_22292/g.61791  ORF Transcript_22292/g.61791 Transcript_22292/m.61791 type:complete len:235 (+) Transcript_22292:355-1059(+)
MHGPHGARQRIERRRRSGGRADHPRLGWDGLRADLRQFFGAAALSDDLGGQIMRVIVDGVPDAPALLRALLHLLADQAVEDAHCPLQRVHALVDSLVVPGPLRPLLRQELLEDTSARALALEGLLVGGVQLLARSLLLVYHVKQVLVARLNHGPVAAELLLLRLLVLVPGLSLPRKLFLDVAEVPVACGLLVAEHLLHQAFVRFPCLAFAAEVVLHRLLMCLTCPLLPCQVLPD